MKDNEWFRHHPIAYIKHVPTAIGEVIVLYLNPWPISNSTHPQSLEMSFFQDTAFGHVVRFVSRGKLLGWQETHDEETRLRYIYGDGKRPSDASSKEMEKGADYRLIEFLENDPQVRNDTYHHHTGQIDD